jgi:outer membrane protein assembly factor BamB
MVGTYQIQSHFPEQTYDWEGGVGRVPFEGVVNYQASNSEIIELIVQDTKSPDHPGFPLPSEFWTRPIDAQMREWSAVAGNDLASNRYEGPLATSPAPESGHILWAKPLEHYGGLVGAELDNHAFEEGDAYEGKFANSVIINGILFYNQFPNRGGTAVENEVVAVNLRTGEELWRRNWNNRRLDFGQILYWDSFNMHGAFPYLWETTGGTWNAYDVTTGRWVYTIENVTSGTNLYGPKGEILRYTVDLDEGWMTLWNSTKTVNPQNLGTSTDGSWRPHGTTYDAARGIEWNVSIPTGLPGSVARVFLDDRIIGTNAPGESNIGIKTNPVELWAINLKPGQEGQLMWQNTWTPPGDFATGYAVRQGGMSNIDDGVFVLYAKEIRGFFGFDIDTGQFLWGPTEPMHYMNMYSLRANIHFGKLYVTGYAGTVTAFDLGTGQKLWEYNALDPYNEILWSDNWALIFSLFTPDHKIIFFTMEHSPIDPKPRGGPTFCIDAETGDEVWKVNIYGTRWGGHNVMGDSIMAAFNAYDNQIYAIGKGPSETTVEASPKVSNKGTSVLIEGMVTDISTGTKDPIIAARFPKGVPAVSDQSMDKWMEYVYMQHPRPMEVTGVSVTLDTVDPNGNFINIGTTMADGSGFYSHKWEPEIEGKYTVIASFTGTGSYWSSYDQTSIFVDPPETPSTPIEPEEPTEPEEPVTPLITTEVAIIAAVAIFAIIGIAAYWLLRRK